MVYQLRFSIEAAQALRRLESSDPTAAQKLKKVRKALGLLQTNSRYPGLHSHQYEQFPGLENEKIWDSYVENKMPKAWRIYWMYGPDEKKSSGEQIPIISIVLIGPHL